MSRLGSFINAASFQLNKLNTIPNTLAPATATTPGAMTASKPVNAAPVPKTVETTAAKSDDSAYLTR